MTRKELIMMLREQSGCSMDLCKRAVAFAEGREGEPLLLMMAFLRSHTLAIATHHKTEEDRAMWFYDRMMKIDIDE